MTVLFYVVHTCEYDIKRLSSKQPNGTLCSGSVSSHQLVRSRFPFISWGDICKLLQRSGTNIDDVCLLPECQNRFSCLSNQKIVKYPGKDWHDGIDSTDWEIDGACCRDQHSDRSKGFPGVIVVDLNDPLDETCWREINILTERQWVWLPDRAMHLAGKDRTVREQI